MVSTHGFLRPPLPTAAHFPSQFRNFLDDFTLYNNVQRRGSFAGTTDGISTVNVAEGGLLSLFPTVATDNVTIVAPEAAIANIFTLQGTIAGNIRLNKGTNNVSISDLANGVYLVKVNNETLKFIKK